MSHNEIVINAPSSFVFPYVSDGDKIAEWSHDERLVISFPRGKKAQVGMQIDFTIKLPSDPRWVVEFTRLDTDQAMETEIIDGIFRGSISFYLEPIDEETTRLIHEAEIFPQGRFMEFAWKTIGEKIHREKMVEIMQKIKHIAEEDWQASR